MKKEQSVKKVRNKNESNTYTKKINRRVIKNIFFYLINENRKHRFTLTTEIF